MEFAAGIGEGTPADHRRTRALSSLRPGAEPTNLDEGAGDRLSALVVDHYPAQRQSPFLLSQERQRQNSEKKDTQHTDYCEYCPCLQTSIQRLCLCAGIPVT